MKALVLSSGARSSGRSPGSGTYSKDNIPCGRASSGNFLHGTTNEMAYTSLDHLFDGPVTESLLVQRTLLSLGGYDASPVFICAIGATSFLDSVTLRDGITVPHLSQGALRQSLVRLLPYASSARCLRIFVDEMDTAFIHSHGIPRSLAGLISLSTDLGSNPGKPNVDHLGDNLISLKNSNYDHESRLLDNDLVDTDIVYHGYHCLVQGVRSLWHDWRVILTIFHRKFTSSLHREFCGAEWSNNTRELLPPEPRSPLWDIFFGCQWSHSEGDSGISEFKVTLLNLEHILSPFLSILLELATWLDTILLYLSKRNLGTESVARVATMVTLLKLRHFENIGNATMQSIFLYLLNQIMSQFKTPLYLGTPGNLDDVSWSYLGPTFTELHMAMETSGHHVVTDQVVHGTVGICYNDPAVEQYMPPSGDTEFRVWHYLGTKALSTKRAALGSFMCSRDKLCAYFDFVSGVCHLRFGDLLDPVFNLITRDQLPVNYNTKLRSLLADAVGKHRQHIGGVGTYGRNATGPHGQLVDAFTYTVDQGTPLVVMEALADRLGTFYPFFSEGVMDTYSRTMSHLLGFHITLKNVKALVRTSLRTNGQFQGFCIPKASLLLLHVCLSLERYYFWVTEDAWTSFIKQLRHCKSDTEVARLHEAYVEYVAQCLLVGPKDPGASGADMGSLFREHMFLIRRCASDILGLCRDGMDTDDGDEIESLYFVLESEVASLKTMLHVLCSLVLPEVPEFGPDEERILVTVVRAGVDLNGPPCKSLAVLLRLLG
eukprot:XP_001612302.1 hypothetical protein [Babesia bovis T2Bo]